MSGVIHYMKLGAAAAYCGLRSRKVAHAYDDWYKVTCPGCLAHPASPVAPTETTEETPNG